MRRTSLLVALLALVGTALVAPPAQAALDPGFEQPAVGTCYRMSEKELRQVSYGEAAVDCAGKHTSQVVAVTYLPDGLSWRRASVGKVTKLAVKGCQPALDAALGGDVVLRAQSAYQLTFFIPTKAQRRAGARWIRCDVVLGLSPLTSLPPTLALTDPLADGVTACLDGRGVVRSCSKKHTFRATGAVTIDRKRYLSDRAFRTVGSRKCQKHITNNKPFYLTWPNKHAWKLGDRTITCYTRTSK